MKEERNATIIVTGMRQTEAPHNDPNDNITQTSNSKTNRNGNQDNSDVTHKNI